MGSWRSTVEIGSGLVMEVMWSSLTSTSKEQIRNPPSFFSSMVVLFKWLFGRLKNKNHSNHKKSWSQKDHAWRAFVMSGLSQIWTVLLPHFELLCHLSIFFLIPESYKAISSVSWRARSGNSRYVRVWESESSIHFPSLKLYVGWNLLRLSLNTDQYFLGSLDSCARRWIGCCGMV